ncbi:MAG TPA: ABC transporter permease [Acidobacteriota bacterium]|nr:ABC transporter permease [Acidobacteriota bacterium]
MMNGFWKLTWVETKVFLREPMGVIGTLIIPALIFVIVGRSLGIGGQDVSTAPQPPFNVAILGALLLVVGAVISLVTIISIYREGGILKRLRATPLSPLTILGAHVFIKLVFTVLGLAVLVLAGRQMIPGAIEVNLLAFTASLLLSTISVLSLGFVIASIVPTARFAQPITAALFYPMLALSGLFFPIDRLARPLEILALSLPTTHAVSLMQGVWEGNGWRIDSTAALILIFGVCTALSTRVFRWE